MSKHWFFGRMMTLALLFSLSVGGCIQPTATARVHALQPGDHIGTMVLAKGPVPFDMGAVPPYPAFCEANPALKPGDTVAKPGVYLVECTVPPLPRWHIGLGWAANNEQLRDEEWSAQHKELYVNGQLVDEAAFGSVDADVPVNAVPGEAAGKVIYAKLRVWNVVLENLTPGPLTLRMVHTYDRDVLQGAATMPAGVYDITYHVTVDAAAAAIPGQEPIGLVDVNDQSEAAASTETPLEQANKAVVQRFYEEVVNQKKVEVFKEVFDPKMTEHSLGFGPQLFRDTDLFAGFPDQHLTVDLWVVENDLVTAVVTVSGTQTGEFIGIAPTGKTVTFSQIDVWRVQDGKITDVWHNFASADILQQVGYTLVPPAQ